MFEISEKVVYGVLGACEIVDIATPPIKGIEGNYYFLQPIYDSKGIIYSPVDGNHTLAMRTIISHNKAEELVERAKNCKEDDALNEKISPSQYDDMIKSQDVDILLHMVRFLYDTKIERAKDLRKMKSIDSRMLTMAKKLLYGELAVALERDLQEVTEEMDSYLGR